MEEYSESENVHIKGEDKITNVNIDDTDRRVSDLKSKRYSLFNAGHEDRAHEYHRMILEEQQRLSDLATKLQYCTNNMESKHEHEKHVIFTLKHAPKEKWDSIFKDIKISERYWEQFVFLDSNHPFTKKYRNKLYSIVLLDRDTAIKEAILKVNDIYAQKEDFLLLAEALKEGLKVEKNLFLADHFFTKLPGWDHKEHIKYLLKNINIARIIILHVIISFL